MFYHLRHHDWQICLSMKLKWSRLNHGTNEDINLLMEKMTHRPPSTYAISLKASQLAYMFINEIEIITIRRIRPNEDVLMSEMT